MIASGDFKKGVLRKNLNRVRLWQYHSTRTSTDPLTNALFRFFDAQRVMRMSFNLPLGVLSDCAPQILSSVMIALALPGQQVITKVVYCNVLTIVIAHCEGTTLWDQEQTKIALDSNSMLSYIPTIVKWCCSHFLRAVHKWLQRTDRSDAVKTNRVHFEIMILTLSRHVTTSLSM